MSRHTPPNKTKAPPLTRKTARLEGAALIIVLAFLIILTGMTVAFLSSVTNEASSTASAASAVNTRTLADTAVQLTIAQIRDATAGFSHDSNGALTANPTCWASQPGAIRTYDTNAANVAVYKLYSAFTMVDTSINANPAADAPSSSSWADSPALYSDLNSPVVSGTNTNYPIMDPYMTNTTNGFALVDGFSISNAPVSKTGGGSVTNAAPMPVVWLYMLQDGSVIAPDSSSATTATFQNATKPPSSNNPIIGRIAFWTDDETCKLNVNTASEGSFWGTPSFSTSADQAFALYPPAAKEYNRYPGHPATTSLSPVLWSYMGLANPQHLLFPLPNNQGYWDISTPTNYPSLSVSGGSSYFTNLFINILPRYGWGGSQGGTNSVITNPAGATSVPLSSSRLYASVDEFFFSTNIVSAARGTNLAGIDAQSVSRFGFFLTAESRAPEVNPLNLPKLTMWPVPDPAKAMVANANSVAGKVQTLKDKTIAFCSTLGSFPYYFTRYDATTSGNDISNDTLRRNQTNYNFFRKQLDQPIPGFKGGAFTSTGKWNALQADQISTEIYDYIRSCINLCDASTATYPLTSYTFSNAYTVPPTPNGSTFANNAGGGQVVPIVITNPDGKVTRGMGRFPTMRAGTLWFTAAAANEPPLMCHPDGKPIVYDGYGNQISTNNAGVSIINTNYPLTVGSQTYARGALVDVVLAGQAYAHINPMHPWTAPYNSAFPNNLSLVGAVPQYLNTGWPVLADNAAATPLGANTKATNDPTLMTSIYPIFSLFTYNNGNANMANTTGTAGTRVFPSYNGTNTNSALIVYNSSATAVKWFLDKAGANKAANFLKNSGGTQIQHYIVSVNTNAANYTHIGLEYLAVQNSNNGSFNIANTAYANGANNWKATVLAPHQTVVEMAYLPNFDTVTPGSFPISPKLSNAVTGLGAFSIGGKNPTFSTATPYLAVNSSIANPEAQYLYDQEMIGLWYQGANLTNNSFLHSTNAIILTSSNAAGNSIGTFAFTGGPVINSIYSLIGSAPQLVQTISMNFPDATFAIPKLIVFGGAGGFSPFPYLTTYTNVGILNPGNNAAISFMKGRLGQFSGGEAQPFLFPSEMNVAVAATNYSDVTIPWSQLRLITADTIQSVDLIYSDPRMITCLSNVPSSFYTNNPLYGYSAQLQINGWPTYLRNAHSLRSGGMALDGGNYGTLVFTNGVNSFNLPPSIAGPNNFQTSLYTNLSPYLAASAPTNIFGYVPTEVRGPSLYISANLGHGARPQAGPDCDWRNSGFQTAWLKGGDFDNGFGFFPDGPYMNKADEGFGSLNGYQNIGNVPYFALAGSVPGSALFSPNRMVPSPILFGSLPTGFSQLGSAGSPSTNILNDSWLTLQFSPNPNAQDASKALSRRSAAGISEAGTSPTSTIVPDYLILDFFQMPVVEPYPISDPFSTAGKVNMNYQIVPFSYINRDAAIRGVLKSVLITAVDNQWGYDYKLRSKSDYSDNGSHNYSDTISRIASFPYNGSSGSLETNSGQLYFHYPINLGETLKQFQYRFTNTTGGDLFRSPSEICSLWLYPSKQPTVANPNQVTNSLVTWDSANANIQTWWYGTGSSDPTQKAFTGDNIRERPYNYIYPRLTTKSNTYKIHYRVQTLKQTPTVHGSGDYSKWIDPGTGSGTTDKVVGELRGSAIIERYIDPSDTTLPDFASSANTNIMDTYYKFRVFNVKQFNP